MPLGALPQHSCWYISATNCFFMTNCIFNVEINKKNTPWRCGSIKPTAYIGINLSPRMFGVTASSMSRVYGNHPHNCESSIFLYVSHNEESSISYFYCSLR